MSKLFASKAKRFFGASMALAGVALAMSVGSTPAKADHWHDGYRDHPHYYYHHPHYYAPPVVYGPPVVYERPVYPPPVAYYGAPGINVTIPLR